MTRAFSAKFWIVILQYFTTVYSQTRTEFIQTLLEDYDNRIPPNFEKSIPTEVDVSLFINSVDSISEQTMDFTVNTFVQQEWTDTRLEFFGLIDAEYLELDNKLISEVWVPDLFFTNEKKASFHDVTVPNKMLHLYQDGRVMYRLRVSLTASCPMNLEKYPMDDQICSLYIQSFAYTSTRLRFRWRNSHPIDQSENLELPQFTVDKMVTSTCKPYGSDSNSNFTCIKMDLHLSRNIGYYMIQIYIPTILIVLLSWVSFWLSIDAVPARISLGILTVLTMTTQKTTAVASLPKVSYVKAIDIWMAACLLFVFSALLEFALVNVMQRRQVKRLTLRRAEVKNGECKAILPIDEKSGGRQRIDPFGTRRAKMIDNISRILFPLSFIAFSAIYWIFYLT